MMQLQRSMTSKPGSQDIMTIESWFHVQIVLIINPETLM